MTAQAAISDGSGGARLAAIGTGVAIGYVAALAMMFARHAWVVDASGAPILTDFVAVWSAGQLALAGAGVTAYDKMAEHAAQVAAIGHGFSGSYDWPYPPQVLFAAAGLASLPYAAAFLAWAFGGAALQGVGIAAITRRPAAAAVALASPWTLAALMVGQNGLITAGLLGLALLCLERRPALAGLLIGLLAYKPQFGLLIPVALIAGGRWRAFGWAVFTTLGLLAAAVAVFGPQTLAAFLQGVPNMAKSEVTGGALSAAKLQSAYGLCRALGASAGAAWTLQAAVTGLAGLAVAMLWRGKASFELKAAGLAAAAVLATPYVFAYDLPVLATPFAFLWRQRPFDRVEYAALSLVALCILPFAFAPVPSGLIASLVVAAVVGRRVLIEARMATPAGGLATGAAAAA
jgi:hypothetical protein